MPLSASNVELVATRLYQKWGGTEPWNALNAKVRQEYRARATAVIKRQMLLNELSSIFPEKEVTQ